LAGRAVIHYKHENTTPIQASSIKKYPFENVPIIGIFETETTAVMAKNTSILLGDYFDAFINKQVKSGKFSSASEVVRAALRMFEHEETKKAELINELKRGEKSGFIEKFNRESFLKNLHKKHVAEK
jgi:antitoxin ParD1/3/4